jgi:hypothetical protein
MTFNRFIALKGLKPIFFKILWIALTGLCYFVGCIHRALPYAVAYALSGLKGSWTSWLYGQVPVEKMYR